MKRRQSSEKKALLLYSFFQNPLSDLENIRMRHHYSKFASNTLLEASTRTEFQQVTSEISIGVEPGDEASVFQVVGECKNSDGTVYTVKTPTYVIRGKDGSSETKKADFSKAEKGLA